MFKVLLSKTCPKCPKIYLTTKKTPNQMRGLDGVEVSGGHVATWEYAG